MAYPMQLSVRYKMHNLKNTNKRIGFQININLRVSRYQSTYLYKLGASAAEACPPKIQTLPTTNQTAKKQSRAILK